MARRDPYYERNKAKLCSFYARGACNRGDLCPYRHEMPKEENELSKQNILDRYHGTNDPVAAKILRKATQKTNDLLPPDDQTITTLFLGNIPDSATENRIRSTFESYGSITNVHVVPSKNVAFVTFARRGSAEEAINQLAGVMTMDGQLIRMAWGKRSSNSGGSSNNISISSTNPVLSDLALKAASTAAANTGDFSSLPKAPPPPGMYPYSLFVLCSYFKTLCDSSIGCPFQFIAINITLFVWISHSFNILGLLYYLSYVLYYYFSSPIPIILGMTPHQYSSMSSTYHAASTASHHPASATTFVPPPPSSYSSAHSSLSRPPPPPPPGLPPKS